MASSLPRGVLAVSHARLRAHWGAATRSRLEANAGIKWSDPRWILALFWVVAPVVSADPDTRGSGNTRGCGIVSGAGSIGTSFKSGRWRGRLQGPRVLIFSLKPLTLTESGWTCLVMEPVGTLEVSRDWAPYTEGYWAYTDAGWTWVSHEPVLRRLRVSLRALAFNHRRLGVGSKGMNGGRLGRPGVKVMIIRLALRFRLKSAGRERGISTWVDVQSNWDQDITDFAALRDFGAPYLPEVLLPPARNLVIIQKTQNVTNITVTMENVFCGGPRYDWVRTRCVSEVPLMRVFREEDLGRYRAMEPRVGHIWGILTKER